MRRTVRSTEEGFLYIEVLAAMAILAFALLAGAPVLLMAARENSAASDVTFATTVAHDMAETIKLQPYGALANGSDTTRLHNLRFDRSWVIEDNVPYPGMKTVTITVVPDRENGMGGNRVAVVRFFRTF